MPRGIPNKKPEVEIVDLFDASPPVQQDAPPVVEASVPEQELTPEQRRIKDLEHLLAQERGKKDPEPELVKVKPGQTGTIVIHILKDGFTANGQVWYRGQELEFDRTSNAYTSTVDRTGTSWLELAGDDFAQAERWGDIFFRPGPWPGKRYVDADNAAAYESLKPLKEGGGSPRRPTREELAAADKAEQRRGRAVPVINR